LNVTVLLFAAAREAAGTDRATLDLPAGASVADAFVRLAERHPRLGAVLPACRAAVDEEFAPRATALCDGATLAVLPPVSGG
jgi:molybdopterin converting factor subunit 1